eukprot:385087_1
MKSMIKGPVTCSIESLSKHLKALHNSENTQKQQHAPSKLTNDISQIHTICYGTIDKMPNLTQSAKLVSKLLDPNENLFLQLTINLSNLHFDAQKQSCDILNYIIRRCNKNKSHQYINSKTDRHNQNQIVSALFDQYEQHASSTLHEMAKRKEFTNMLLNIVQIPYKYTNSQNGYQDGHQSKHIVEQLFELSENKCFNVSMNAYKTLYQLLINGHKEYVRQYLNNNFSVVFNGINKLIKKDHFVTQKQFLFLLRDLLTGKGNFEILKRYTSKKDNLAIIMNLMKKCKQNSISYEAYHIFKIFIANPNKDKDIMVILWKNKQKLVDLLVNFHENKIRDDEQFGEDKSVVIQCIKNISLNLK